ncbi:MAG: hypothetical protein IKQ04_05845 [Oscillospiraceae bacterium]|nr:hypothetical protein [Oscillospiraceae bacterium]MBR7010285.1 hypothetical protein [Oscillospiraceae bacterium]
MAKILSASRYFRDAEPQQRQILFCLLTGSLAGALGAALFGPDSGVCLGTQPRLPSWFGIFFHIALFPLLLSAAYLLGRGNLIRALFFLRGAVLAGCFCALSAGACFRWLLCFLDTALLLPFWISLGAVWCRGAAEAKSETWLLLPALLLAAAAACLKSLLFIQ